jgi:MFS family permease
VAEAGRFPALRHRNFRRYVIGQGISLSGFWMHSVAQAWLVYRLSGSELALGGVAFVATLPVLLFSPLAGVAADRMSRYRLIMTTQLGAMLVAFGLGTLTALHLATVPLVVVFAFVQGTIGAFDLPIRQAFVIDMVGREDVSSAVAMNATIFNAARVVGPAVAGLLVGTLGEAPCFFLNGASYLALVWALLGMELPRQATVAPGGPASGLRAGLAYVRSRPALAALLMALGVVSALAFQANVLMPALAHRTFGRDAQGYGLLLTAYGLGAVVSAIHLASRRHTLRQHRRNIVFGLGVLGGGLLGVAWSPSFGSALACQVVAGLGLIRFTATTNTVLQTLSDDAFRGRVMGLHTVMFLGTAPLGSLVLGALAEPLGPQWALVVSGAAPLAALAFLLPRLQGLGAPEASGREARAGVRRA